MTQMQELERGVEFNTFTTIGRCERTGALGVVLASSPLTVASRCPFIKGGLAAISTQSFTNPHLAPIIFDLLGHGYSPAAVIDALRVHDRHFDYRQVGIVTQDGRVAVHSGKSGKDWTGHIVGDGFLAMGNTLVGPQVVDAMAKAFKANGGELLEERLMRAIEAGGDAGGEAKGQLSAGILVAEPGQRPRTDLRVEMANPTPERGGNAIRDLRRIVDAFKPMIRYYQVWPNDPTMENWRDWNARESKKSA
ncbi:MAG: DUF1028 domain-containing protein [Alphaproteobacteria bacterium]|nr:DUF1028 domain-containing protein [Alphaproteobacteria bacterium]